MLKYNCKNHGFLNITVKGSIALFLQEDFQLRVLYFKL